MCSPRASQAAAVSSESLETQEEREKAWMRGGRQPEILSSGLFGFKILILLHLLFGLLTMVGELAAPLPGTARGLTVWPSQDKCLQSRCNLILNSHYPKFFISRDVIPNT